MSRNRMIKPEFWSSETLSSVSLESRLIFIGIWNFCDDYGFCLNSSRSLLGDLFPVDESVTESKLKGWIGELIKKKLLIPLSYNNKNLLFVRSWGEHQTVNNKSKRCHIELNDLEQVIKDTLDNNETLISVYLESHAPKRKKKEKEERESKKDFTPPTFEEFNNYCSTDLSEYILDAKNIYEGYSLNDWHDSKGNKVKNWKLKLRQVWCKNKKQDGLFQKSYYNNQADKIKQEQISTWDKQKDF